MSEKFYVLAPYALSATVTLFAMLTGGCDRREEVYTLEGKAYAQDPAYIAQLKSQVGERDELVKERRKILAALDRLREELGDNVAVTNSAKGMKLLAALEANSAANTSNRLATAEIIRARIQRATLDSERIQRGEAKAIDISNKKQK